MSSRRQYTIRNIPADVDRTLRLRAKQLGKSFNQVALEALVAGAGHDFRPKRDFSGVVGSLTAKEAERLDEEIRLQRQIDPDLWR
jgi:plasmid stability protein